MRETYPLIASAERIMHASATSGGRVGLLLLLLFRWRTKTAAAARTAVGVQVERCCLSCRCGRWIVAVLKVVGGIVVVVDHCRATWLAGRTSVVVERRKVVVEELGRR